MKIREEVLELDGLRLKRFLFTPDSESDIRAATFHLHGQGDYTERYDEIMELFTQEGIACVSTDLPGHGRSEGKRGRISGFGLVDRIAQSNREICRKLCPESRGPLGILGHSAGGLMALRELLLRPNLYTFSWISSPLIQPEANQNPILIHLAPILARLFPGLTVSTGVTSDDCVHPGNDAEPGPERDEALFHARISLGWGYAMILAARDLRSQIVSHPPSLPLLLTQGGSDPICPPEYLREVLSRATIPNLRYCEFPEALHEPFADSGKDEVFATIKAWLKEVRLSPDPAHTE